MAGQAFSALSDLRGWVGDWNRADQTAKPLCSGPTAMFFSSAGRPVLPLSFSLGMDRRQAHDGGARNRQMAVRTARTMEPMMATSASWKVMARAWRTTRAPILINFSCRLVNDQSASAARFSARASVSVSNHPICKAEAACASIARPPTTLRRPGQWPVDQHR